MRLGDIIKYLEYADKNLDVVILQKEEYNKLIDTKNRFNKIKDLINKQRELLK